MVSMKAKNLLITIVTIMSLFNSCGKAKDSSPLSTLSKFSYNGKEYPLDKGYIHLSVGTRFYVSLFSSSVTITTNNGELFMAGKGNGVTLSLDSTIPTDIASGTYKWPDQTTPGSLMISDAEMGITNENTSSINGTFLSATYGAGSVTVSKSGLTYTINFSILINGKTASGQYVGTLENY